MIGNIEVVTLFLRFSTDSPNGTEKTARIYALKTALYLMLFNNHSYMVKFFLFSWIHFFHVMCS